MKDGKIAIRYNADDKLVICSGNLTPDSPLCMLNDSKCNPDILN